jgi:hypothetical protein
LQAGGGETMSTDQRNGGLWPRGTAGRLHSGPPRPSREVSLGRRPKVFGQPPANDHVGAVRGEIVKFVASPSARRIDRLRVEILGPLSPYDARRFGALRLRLARLSSAHEGSLLVLISAGLYVLAIAGAIEGLRLGPSVFSFIVGVTTVGSSAAISSHLSWVAQRR